MRGKDLISSATVGRPVNWARALVGAVALTFIAADRAMGQDHNQIQDVLARQIVTLMESHKVPGASVAVVHNHRLVWAQGFGVREARAEKVDADTLFQMASVSKPVFGLGVMVLTSRNELDLDVDVNTMLKNWHVAEGKFTQKQKVTLRLLLGHRAGTTVHGFPGYPQGRAVPTLEQILDGKPPANTAPVLVNLIPGTQTRYSGGGYCIAQLAITNRTGKAFPDLMDELVLRPLKMNRSTYAQPLPAEFRGNAATGHRFGGAPVAGRYHTYPEMAAAGLWSTRPTWPR